MKDLLRAIAWETASQKAMSNFPREGGGEVSLYVISAKEGVHSCTLLSRRSLLVTRTRYLSLMILVLISLQYSCLENSMDRGAGGLESMGSQRVEQTGRTTKQLTLLLSVWEDTRIQVHEKFFLKYI